MKFLTVSLAALVSLFGAGGANAGIVNGSFETPSVPNGGFTNYDVGSAALTGWTVFGPSGAQVSIVSNTFAQNGVSFPAQDGIQWLDLTGENSNSSEGVSQTVATTVGHLYQLSFAVGSTTGGGLFGVSSTVAVSLNGVLTFTDTNSMASPTTQAWQVFSETFVANSPMTTIAFQNADPASDNDNGLDNVVLNDLGAVSAVPEPASFQLLGSGLAALVLAKRKWRHGRGGVRIHYSGDIRSRL